MDSGYLCVKMSVSGTQQFYSGSRKQTVRSTAAVKIKHIGNTHADLYLQLHGNGYSLINLGDFISGDSLILLSLTHIIPLYSSEEQTICVNTWSL